APRLALASDQAVISPRDGGSPSRKSGRLTGSSATLCAGERQPHRSDAGETASQAPVSRPEH
ncbi:MAG TPA: hypothetical protein VFQ61_17165, partial [Polyangiaceae bacterium]|nr:hypothetical protein [Polyangiaceae bacterium]